MRPATRAEWPTRCTNEASRLCRMAHRVCQSRQSPEWNGTRDAPFPPPACPKRGKPLSAPPRVTISLAGSNPGLANLRLPVRRAILFLFRTKPFVAIFHNVRGDRREASIHPEYSKTTITCACGAVYNVGSLRKHPGGDLLQVPSVLYRRPGIVDTAGRVEKFRRKYGYLEGEDAPESSPGRGSRSSRSALGT